MRVEKISYCNDIVSAFQTITHPSVYNVVEVQFRPRLLPRLACQVRTPSLLAYRSKYENKYVSRFTKL